MAGQPDVATGDLEKHRSDEHRYYRIALSPVRPNSFEEHMAVELLDGDVTVRENAYMTLWNVLQC